ncbi:MAG: hypothetical protein U1F24_10455 [Alphaproteobacteria bacterium]
MEPAGTEFTLACRGGRTVTPKEALAGDICGSKARPAPTAARPAPPCRWKGQSGMTVWHFSIGASLPAGRSFGRGRRPVRLARSRRRPPASARTADWRRAQTEQDYQSGRIDAVKHDTEIGIINDLKERLAAEAAEAAARFSASRRGRRRVGGFGGGVAETIAERGDPADLDRLTDLMRDILAAERQAQLLGKTTGIGGRTEEIMRRYADGFATAAPTSDMGRQTAKFVLDLERTMQMTGLSSDDLTGGVAASTANGRPAASSSQSPYGRAVITLKKILLRDGRSGAATPMR